MTKECRICNTVKDESLFSKDKKNKDGLDRRCKNCVKIYHQSIKSKMTQRSKDWIKNNPDRFKNNYKKYRSTLKGKNTANEYIKKRRKTDINFRISRSLRSRLKDYIKNNCKSGSAVRDLGCSVEKFILWIEMNWKDGMTWDNYGLHGWHLDHIKPLSKFNLEDRNQFLEANHFTNLQPLWANENWKKGDKYCE